MAGVTSGAGTAYPSGAPEFTPIFSGVCVTRSLYFMYVLYIIVCPFVIFLLAIVLSVLLRYKDSDYPFTDYYTASYKKYQLHLLKKSFKFPKRSSEAITRRRENTMAKNVVYSKQI